MWNLPGPGIEPMFPALAGRFLNPGPPGKSRTLSLWLLILVTSRKVLFVRKSIIIIELICPDIHRLYHTQDQYTTQSILYQDAEIFEIILEFYLPHQPNWTSCSYLFRFHIFSQCFSLCTSFCLEWFFFLKFTCMNFIHFLNSIFSMVLPQWRSLFSKYLSILKLSVDYYCAV